MRPADTAPLVGRCVLAALSLGIASLDGRAATYYVATNGSDGNSGSSSSPWRTPGYGSRQLQPGDTLIIRAGRYVLNTFDADIITPPTGTSSQWITIKGESGALPVLAGGDNLISAVDLAGVSYLRLENLEITHDDQAAGSGLYFREGISIVGGQSRSLILQDLYVHHLDEFGLDAQDLLDTQIINCRFEYCGFGGVGGPAAAQGGWRNVTIQGCTLSYSGRYYQGGDGSNRPYDRPDGFGIEESQGPILIVDTRAEHNYGDGLDSKASNTTIRRCYVANNSCDGVKLWGGGTVVENTLIHGRGDGNPTVTPWSALLIGTTQANSSFTLINNTIDDALGNNYLAYAQYDDAVPINLTIRNCIFRATGPGSSIWLRDLVTLTADHNLFYRPDPDDTLLEHGASSYTASNIGSLGTGNLYGDPLFIAPAWGQTGNYRLQAGSPAINAGSAAGAPVNDLDGLPRDAQPDVGSYEYGATGGCALSCSATVPGGALTGSAVSFQSSASLSGCSATISYAWDFGDGSTANQQNASHTYAAAGTYPWTMTASGGGASPCTRSGSIDVSDTALPDLTGEWTSVRKRRGGVSASFTCRNAGLANSGGFTVRIYFSKSATVGPKSKLIKSQDISSLAAGAGVAITARGTPASRQKYIVARVDATAAVVESNESNNTVAEHLP